MEGSLPNRDQREPAPDIRGFLTRQHLERLKSLGALPYWLYIMTYPTYFASRHNISGKRSLMDT